MNKLGTIGNDELKGLKDVLFSALVLGIVILLLENPAFASNGGAGGAMPWESALGTIRDSISGPVAMAVSLIAIVASGVMLVFGGDMQGFMKTAAYISLVVGLIVAANNILTTLYPQSANISFLG